MPATVRTPEPTTGQGATTDQGPVTSVPRRRAPRARRTDRVLARESRAARPHFAAGAGLGVAMAMAIVAQAGLLAHVIAAAAIRHATLGSLRVSLIALAGVFCIRALLSGGFELSGRLGAGRVMVELRHRLATRLLVDRPGRAPGERTGDLAAAAVQGVDSLENYFAGYLPALMMAAVVPVAVIVWVLHADLICALILAVTVPVLITFMILIGLGANSLTLQRWRTLALLSSHFLDVVQGLETLRAHRREQAQVDTLATVGERYRTETMATLRLAFLSALVLEGCAMLGTALVAATIGVQLTSGHLTLEAGLSVLLLAPELYAPLRAVGQQFHASADGLAAAELVLSAAGSPRPSEAARSAAPGPGSPHTAELADIPDPRRQPVRFTDVSFLHPGRPDPVLRALDFTLAPGVLTALTGPSGAGKSTLAALTLGLAAPSAGTVSCGGVDLRQIPAARWQRRCAWVPQRATLFSATLAENIALARPEAGVEAILSAANQAGLAAVLNALPDGLGTQVGDGGRRLSAGQGQRVALARAFLADTSLVVLDEPTANLDAETTAAITDAIVALAQNRTVLVITHDADLAERASVTLELRHGQIAVTARLAAVSA